MGTAEKNNSKPHSCTWTPNLICIFLLSHSSNIKLQDCFKSQQNSYRNKQDAWNVHRYEALSCMHVLQWFKMFREGCEDSIWSKECAAINCSKLGNSCKNSESVAKGHHVTLKIIFTLNRRWFLIFLKKIWERRPQQSPFHRLKDELMSPWQWSDSSQILAGWLHVSAIHLNSRPFVFPKVKTALKLRIQDIKDIIDLKNLMQPPPGHQQ